jgi:hypothetical protein
MWKVCSSPLTSSHFHLIVPIITLVFTTPPNPLITRFAGFNSPTKWSVLSEMHAVHLLLMPIVVESVSNLPMLSWLLTLWCSIMMVTAKAMAVANRVGLLELMMVRACPVNRWYALVLLLPLFELIFVPRYIAASSNHLFIQSMIGPMFHFLLDLGMCVWFDSSGVMSIIVDTN